MRPLMMSLGSSFLVPCNAWLVSFGKNYGKSALNGSLNEEVPVRKWQQVTNMS